MNLVVLSGRVSTDMVLRYTKKGTSVVSFDIAVRKSFTKDAEGNYPTDFFHIVAWNKLAESCQKNLIKGRMVLVKGSLAMMIIKTNKALLIGRPSSKQSWLSSLILEKSR